MKKFFILLLAGAFLAALVVGAGTPIKSGSAPGTGVKTATDGSGLDLIALLSSRYSRQELEAGTVVGSEFCIACHGSEDHEVVEWRDTYHSHALRKPMGMYSLQAGKGVMADYDKNGVDDFKQGLDFNAISSALDATKPNAPILSYDATKDAYYIQLGPTGLKIQVVATWAGMSAGNGQRFVCRVPVTDTPTGWSNAVYFGPLAWGGSSYSSGASSWYNGSTPKYAPGITTAALGDATTGLQAQNYLKNCSGCHITGIRKAYVTPQGEAIVNPFPAALVPDNSPNYPDIDGDGIPDVVNIGCESCHGPGSAHILGGGDPAKIVNPADLPVSQGYTGAGQARSAVCFQCHVQTGSAPSKFWGFSYDETANRGFFVSNPIDDLTKYQVSKAVKYPDGVHYSTQRIDSYYASAHYEGGRIACNDCHNPHAETRNPAQIRDTITRSGVTVENTKVEDDSFCLACHAGHFGTVTKQQVKDWKAAGWDAPITTDLRAQVEAHAHHPYGADRELGLARCTGCHYANGHDAWVAKPEDTIKYKDSVISSTVKGNPNGCSVACHRGQAIVWTDVPANLTYTDKLYNTDNEIKLANHLVEYFGPEGEWWKTVEGERSESTLRPPLSPVKRHVDLCFGEDQE